ncbi:MAG: DEAD/DEAH box helicase [Oceanicaulis sp.]
MRFEIEPVEGGVLIRHRPGFLEKKRPPEDWAETEGGALARAIAVARSHDDPDEARHSVFSPDHLFLSDALSAALDEASAHALGLPPPPPFGLRLETTDQVKSPDFRVRARWVQGGGMPVRTKRDGAALLSGGKRYRIAEPAYTLLELAAPLAQDMDEQARLAAYANLNKALSDAVGAEVETDGYLGAVTVYQASAFSLQLGIHDDSFDFDPVLFGRDVASEAEAGETIDEARSALLPPVLQDLFAKQRFRADAGARPAYVLQDGSFVVIDPALRPALGVVRQASSADTQTRRRFITNPTGFIRDALGEEFGDVVDRLFIETEQFSERVTGVDVWRQPVLPWIKPKPNSWIPESFGLRVGESEIALTSGEVREAKADYAEAESRGAQSFKVKEHDVPVSGQTRDALDDLGDLADAVEAAGDQADQTGDADGAAAEADGPPPLLADKRFLTITDNFDQVRFEALTPARDAAARAPAEPPDTVLATLKSYQLEGFRWLAAAKSAGMPGVLLADDMGLGKTLQALSFLALSRKGSDAPVLIVAPTGLLSNWKAEIDKHLKPGALGECVDAYGAALRDMKVHPQAGAETRTGRTILDVQRWRDAGVVLTTYETMRDYHFSFAKVRFSALVFDEVQKLKNPASQISRAARSLNADFKIGMSGTPVENRLQDLWSLMDVLWPGFLGSSRAFEQSYPADDPDKLQALHDRIFKSSEGRPAVGLRRLKTDELDGLPEKHEHSEAVEMPDAQAQAYRSVVARAVASRDGVAAGDGMLKLLQDLRSISLHPEPPADGYGDMDAYVARSARLKKTIEILDAIHGRGEKALVFLESLDMQAFLADYTRRRYKLAAAPARIHGGVPGVKRQGLVDRFQSGPPGFDLMILSPKAGGVGLTITAANHVIHLSRWWNPAVEDQSTDRAFRLGQTRTVSVYYPIAVHPSAQLRDHSFDLKLDALLRRKRSLAGHMLAPPEDVENDARALFGDVTFDADAPDAASAAEPELDEDAASNESAASGQERAAPAPEPAAPPDTPRPPLQPVAGLVRSPEGSLPDLDEVFFGLEDAVIRELELIDPYTFWTKRAQRGLTAITLHLAKATKGVRLMRVVAKPQRSIDGAEFDTEDQAVSALRTSIYVPLRATGASAPRIAFEPRRKTQDRDFHDRFVVMTYELNGERRRREYLFTRGLEAVAEKSWACDIVMTQDTSVERELA